MAVDRAVAHAVKHLRGPRPVADRGEERQALLVVALGLDIRCLAHGDVAQVRERARDPCAVAELAGQRQGGFEIAPRLGVGAHVGGDSPEQAQRVAHAVAVAQVAHERQAPLQGGARGREIAELVLRLAQEQRQYGPPVQRRRHIRRRGGQ
jgi:hypothetical protein